MLSKLSTNVKLKKEPKSGKEAYALTVASLEAEIKEKQSILSELRSAEVKRKFIRGWNAKTSSVNVGN